MIQKIKNEGIYFGTALMFFTRIPIPFQLPYSDELMNKSQKHYASVGLVVGLINAACIYLLTYLFPMELAVLLTMGISILTTGGFHEDGFIDVCDSFGGGYGKEKILTIMKDSRVGAYGVLGMLVLFALKWYTMVYLLECTLEFTLFVVVAAHVVSRYFSNWMIYTHTYVRDIDQSKSKPIANKSLPIREMTWGAILIAIIYCFYGDWRTLLILPIAYLPKVYLAWYFKKHIGGYTGDCLGAIQQVCEVFFYLGALIVWRFMF